MHIGLCFLVFILSAPVCVLAQFLMFFFSLTCLPTFLPTSQLASLRACPPDHSCRWFLQMFNPVLVTIEVLGIPPLVVPTAAVVFALHTVANDAATVFFYSMRVFLHSILSIFFRSIEVVGAENIPTKGPVIFTGNHSNQFVDGLQVVVCR